MKTNNRQHKAFTMLELLFVIVIMGILANFGVELLSQAYKSFIFSKINNKLQSDSAYATEFITKRLENRIKQSVIFRNPALGNSDVNFRSLESGTDTNASVLEWIGADLEGYRNGTWSGIIDLNSTMTNANQITSLNTNTNTIDTLIRTLSYNTSTVNDAAIYFVGNYTANHEWGWDGDLTKFDTLANVDIYPVNSDANVTRFIPAPTSVATPNSFSGVSAKEYYKLSWTAYAVALEDYNATTNMGNLFLYHNYQPWKGEQYDDTGINVQKNLILNNVSSFQFRSAGSLIKIQVCTKDVLIASEEYSLCKEKTVY